MKIIECYVYSFGKLKNFSYKFNNGLNVINEDNGWGKSTFAVFIKSMFYGLNDNKRNLQENERKKYAPWNSIEKFGGRIKFSRGDKEFEIERFFGKKSSDDTVKLTDLSTGLSHYDNIDWGKRIFKIDADGFLSTIYFSQKDIDIKDNRSLIQKYSEAYEVEESEQYSKAVQKIETKLKSFSYSGGRGLIPQAKEEIFHAKNILENQKKAISGAEFYQNNLPKKEERLAQLKLNSKKLSEKWEKSCSLESINLQKEQLKELTIKKDQLLTELSKSESILNNNSVDKAQLQEYENYIDKLSVAKEKKKILTTDLLSLEQKENNKTQKSNKNNLLIALMCLACLLFVSGIVLCVISQFVFAILTITFAIVLLIFIIYFKKNNKATLTYNDLIKEKKQHINQIDLLINDLTCVIDGFINLFYLPKDIFYDKALNLIDLALDNKNKLQLEIEEINNKINSCNAYIKSKTSELDNENNFDNFSATTIKESLEKTDYEIRKLEQEITEDKILINSLLKDGEMLAETESKINYLEEQVVDYQEQCRILDLTITNLKLADQNLRVKYRQPLVESLNKYLGYLSQGQTIGDIDINLKMNVKENGLYRDVEYYSCGLNDMFNVCKRFALTDVLFTEEKPFIILDDPFCNFDEKRTKEVLSLLEKMQSDYQILYLICHSSRAPKN